MRHLLRAVSVAPAVLTLLGAGLLSDRAAAQDTGSRPLMQAKQYHKNKETRDRRIINGEDSDYRRNPWQVALLNAEDAEDPARAQFCGGVIVHSRWVLTAAHCVDGGTEPGQVRILSGTAYLRPQSGSRAEVERIIVHPQWSRTTRDFDIALIRVKTAVKGRRIEAAAGAAVLGEGTKIWVSGWGVTDKERGIATDVLQGVAVDYVSSADCNSPLSYGGKITENMFCAGIKEVGGQDSCQGDSGGPASTGTGDGARLVGLVSWGYDCALQYKYGVYTRLANFVEWVKENSDGEVSW